MPSQKKINFTTKEESKKLQQEQFLSLNPSERFLYFIRNMAESQKIFQTKDNQNTNFILTK